MQMVVEKKMEPTIVIIHEDSPYHLKAFVMGGVMTVLLMGMAFGYILAVGHYGQYHSGKHSGNKGRGRRAEDISIGCGSCQKL